jgi:aspartate aminotransferase-like enzyme
MFGPNHSPRYHHREPDFCEHYADTVRLFCQFANVDPIEWDVFFVTGSGTCAIQTILYSVNKNLDVVTSGHFSDRLKNYLADINKLDGDSPVKAGVVYETSISNYNDDLPDDIFMCDCVSSFPYYEPKGEIWATVTSKQLGCSPGLSVVVMRKSLWDDNSMNPADESYLSLAKYKAKSGIHQTPHTPAITLIDELNNVLRNYSVDSFREMISGRRNELIKHIPADQIIGDGPVMTIKDDERSQALTTQFNLYNNSSDGPQIFLWSGSNKQYDKLFRMIGDIYK